ncbi:hypothetical protein RBB50_001690 [Rhinocladiella similis]
MPVQTQWVRVSAAFHNDGRYSGHGHGHAPAPTNNVQPSNMHTHKYTENNKDMETSLYWAQTRVEKAKRIAAGLQTSLTTKMSELDRLKKEVKSAEAELSRARRERDVKSNELEREKEKERRRRQQQQQQQQQMERERARKGARRMVQVFFT